MINLKNKKADERYLSPWMFLIWAIIGISIVIGALIFLSVQADARQAEAYVLATRILDCASSDFDYAVLTGGKFDFYEECSLDKNVFENAGIFYANLSVGEENSEQRPQIFSAGANFEVECGFQLEANRAEKWFAQCSFKQMSVYDAKLKKTYVLEVTAASSQR